MPRRNRPARREVQPDPIYGSRLAGVFINKLMQRGKRRTAERVFYDALDIMQSRANRPGMEVFEQAVQNATPLLEVKPRRVGGSTYQVPVEISRARQLALGLRWLRQFSSQRRGMPMEKAMATEIMDAYNNQGSVIKRREDTHKMAQANKAFAHYAW